MAKDQVLTVKALKASPAAGAFFGVSVTRATARAELKAHGFGIGTLYVSKDRMYLKLADAGADTDLEKVTTSAAD